MPADYGNPCDDCGHSDEGCSRDPEMRCLGWVPESVQPALSEEDALNDLKTAIDFYESETKEQWESNHRSPYMPGTFATNAYKAIAALRAQLAERTKALGTAAYHLDEWGEYFDNIAGASDPVSAKGLRRKAGICREQAAHARAALGGKEPTK